MCDKPKHRDYEEHELPDDAIVCNCVQCGRLLISPRSPYRPHDAWPFLRLGRHNRPYCKECLEHNVEPVARDIAASYHRRGYHVDDECAGGGWDNAVRVVEGG